MAQLKNDNFHQIEIFEFLKSNKNLFDGISDTFKCVICKSILVDPQFLICGCEACKTCLDEYLKTNKFCPGLNDDCKTHKIYMEDIISSSINKVKINKLKISCFKKDCDYEGKIEDLVNHVKSCNLKPGCPLKRFGCEIEVSERTKLEEHMTENMGVHFKLLVEMNQNLKNEIMDELKSDKMNLVENNNEASGTQLKSIIEMNENLHKEIDELKNMVKDLTGENKRMYDELSGVKNELNVIRNKEKDLTDKIKRMDDELSGLKNELIVMGDKEEDLTEKIELTNERINNVASFGVIEDNYEWTIRNIVEKLRNGTSDEYTEVFEIRLGYNMRFHFKFNSDEEIDEPHFSVFCQFAAGPRDDELEWPCIDTICFGLKNFRNDYDQYAYLNYDSNDVYFSVRPTRFGIEKIFPDSYTLSYLQRHNFITNRGNLVTHCKSIF